MVDTDWGHIRKHARNTERPAAWPAGVSSISLEGLSLLGIDDENRLYWDGRQIATLTLTFWQKLGALLITAAAMVGAISAVISAVAALGPQPSRYQVTDLNGQILRVDTASGAARECMLTDQSKTVCKDVFDNKGRFAP